MLCASSRPDRTGCCASSAMPNVSAALEQLPRTQRGWTRNPAQPMMVGGGRVADLVPLRESHPWLHHQVGHVLKRTPIEAAPSALAPAPKEDVVAPDPLGGEHAVKELGVTSPEPGEQGQLRSRDSTGNPPGANIGVVPADGRELKVWRAQTRPFQVQQR